MIHSTMRPLWASLKSAENDKVREQAITRKKSTIRYVFDWTRSEKRVSAPGQGFADGYENGLHTLDTSTVHERVEWSTNLSKIFGLKPAAAAGSEVFGPCYCSSFGPRKNRRATFVQSYCLGCRAVREVVGGCMSTHCVVFTQRLPSRKGLIAELWGLGKFVADNAQQCQVQDHTVAAGMADDLIVHVSRTIVSRLSTTVHAAPGAMTI